MMCVTDRTSTWDGWLKDPKQVRRLQQHPDEWGEALVAARPFLKECLRRAGALRHSPWLYSHDDWVQVAEVCLWQAVCRYDPDRGMAPMSYLVPMVVGYLRNEQARTSVVHVPHHVWESGRLVLTFSLSGPVPESDDLAWEDLLATADEDADWLVDWSAWWGQQTPRTQRVLRCLAAGRTNAAIAQSLGISATTVTNVRRRARASWRQWSAVRR